MWCMLYNNCLHWPGSIGDVKTHVMFTVSVGSDRQYWCDTARGHCGGYGGWGGCLYVWCVWTRRDLTSAAQRQRWKQFWDTLLWLEHISDLNPWSTYTMSNLMFRIILFFITGTIITMKHSHAKDFDMYHNQLHHCCCYSSYYYHHQFKQFCVVHPFTISELTINIV